MSRHLVCLKILLNIRQSVPRIGILDLPLAQDLVSIRKIIRRSHLALDLGEFTEPKAQFLLPGMALGPHLIPARPVALAVTLDVRRLCMKGEMGSGKGKKVHKRALRMFLFMLAQDLHRMIGNRIGHVKIITHLGRALLDPIQKMKLQTEKPVVAHVVGTVEPRLHGLAVDMPLARMIGTVTGRLEELGQELGPARTPPPVAPELAARDLVPVDLLGIVARHHGCPGRPATGSVVKLGKAQTVLGQRIQVGGLDLPPVATQVGIAQVIRQNDQDVGNALPWGGNRKGAEGEKGGKNKGKASHATSKGEETSSFKRVPLIRWIPSSHVPNHLILSMLIKQMACISLP